MHTDKASTQKSIIARALDSTTGTHQAGQLERSAQRDIFGDGHKCYNESIPNERGRRGGHHISTTQSGRRPQRNVKEDIDTCREVFGEGKEADIVVLDASVLIHCLNRVKDWCKKGRQEILVVPLEALNTLDFLKKGSSSLAQKARAASRLLEAQVGSNPRVKVQRDDAFVPWDDITFEAPEIPNGSDSAGGRPLSPPPEWLRRTICCAQWEIRNALMTRTSNETHVMPSAKGDKTGAEQRLPPNENATVAIAVMNNGPSDPAFASTGRYDRADGALTRIWSRRAKIDVILVEPMPISTPSRGQGNDKREFRDGRKDKDRRPSLVEKPIAIAIVNDQPPKTLRLLARGEKLDP